MNKDTIAAIATAVGWGGIGIVRISGAKAFLIGDAVFRSRRHGRVSQQPNFTARYGTVIDPVSNEVLDEAIALVMRSPSSYTKEDVLELQCHGGPAALSLVLKQVLNRGARLARPGEFTQRAFLNGRLDLAQAEAVCDIILANTEANLKMAQQQLKGRLSEQIGNLRRGLLELEAWMEVGIDFPEDDILELNEKAVIEKLAGFDDQLTELIRQGETGQILREGLAVVIVGKPNVGKSSLLNALVGRKRALVTDIPGTTRDVIEETINISGLPVRILDTAGIRQADDQVEQLGVEAAKEELHAADLVLMVIDAVSGWKKEDQWIYSLCQDKKTLILVNKIDLVNENIANEFSQHCPGEEIIALSAKEGLGLKQVEDTIYDWALKGKVQQEHVNVSNLRHVEALIDSKMAIEDAAEAAQSGFGYDIVSMGVRSARFELGKITGESVDHELVDRIFQDFCIGK